MLGGGRHAKAHPSDDHRIIDPDSAPQNQAEQMRKPGDSDFIRTAGLDGWRKARAVWASVTGG